MIFKQFFGRFLTKTLELAIIFGHLSIQRREDHDVLLCSMIAAIFDYLKSLLVVLDLLEDYLWYN